MPFDAFFSRIKAKARSNQLAVVLGGQFSGDAAIPILAKQIEDEFGVEVAVRTPFEYYRRWNELVDLVEAKVGREQMLAFVVPRVNSIPIQEIHRKLACIPISNFIDLTFDRSLANALVESGKQPIIHAFAQQRMGGWRQSNPDHPNVFFSFAELHGDFKGMGLHEQLCPPPQNRIASTESILSMEVQKPVTFARAENQRALETIQATIDWGNALLLQSPERKGTGIGDFSGKVRF